LWNDGPVEKDRPGVIAPPPLIFLAAFLIGYLCRNFVPRLGSPSAGAAVAVAGMLLIAWALAQMLRAHTHVDPYQPSTTLVTSGPYRFSRNPIYLAMTILYIAGAIALRITAALITVPLALVVLHVGVILREERYLERKFGDRYRQYRSHVRRWI
jgi:protein-S-isoprenylcysteine O-methyltransferase Ste14